jgi:phosphoglycolate phosphatase
MKLSTLLKYNDIVIQCHDNPDADALASGYALYWYLVQKGKSPRFIYRGHSQVQKSNLMIMIDSLSVPVSYEPDFDEKPELLVTVDCQYGEKNVTKTAAEFVAMIDHHQSPLASGEMAEIRGNIGSCSTIIWDMIREEGLDVNDDRKLATAMYYGLFTDTNRLSEMSHPLDRDMVDNLVIYKSMITEMSNSNITLRELKITGRAIMGYEYFYDDRYMLISAEKCDPNILGVISDFAMETAGVNVCIAYYSSPSEIKFSVRSCVKEVHADELAGFLAEGVGGGGGHLTKAGGTIRPDKLMESIGGKLDENDINEKQLTKVTTEHFKSKMKLYYESYEIIYARTAEIDRTGMKLYEKLPQELGVVKLTDIFPAGSMAGIRTLEGDIDLVVSDDIYLMIGIEGEVYPITEAKLTKSYKLLDKKYDRKFEYSPSIRNSLTGEVKKVLEYSHACISTGISRIYARPLTRKVKLFTAWDEEKYYSGDPDDIIAVREDDPHDIYVIRGRLFSQLYVEIPE